MKKYNCPFCSERFYRHDLAKHIDKKHDDELPLDYTAYRMAYDVINNKHGHGNCVVCGKPTKWNEKHQKYNRLCGDPKCAKKIKETYQKRMMRVYNKTHLLNDPEQQEKMLAHRRISGKYKWSDGKMFTYTGSYEKKFMEFLDKIMDFKSSEVVAPGPVLEYEFKGKKLHWITDFLIVPYNLIVEIKDGGNNPNNRQMPTYRSKQIAKEKMITNMGEYSYIRLTDNDFGQFLAIIAELKKDIVEDQVKPLYRIHEDAGLEESVGKIYTKKYKNFEELCSSLETPYDVNNWYNANKIRWTTEKERAEIAKKANYDSDGPFIRWPDQVIKTKIAICMDNAIFMHYFCNSKNIENKILILIGSAATTGILKRNFIYGHAVSVFEIKNKGIFIFDYTDKTLSGIKGPYNSFDEAKKKYLEDFKVNYINSLKEKTKESNIEYLDTGCFFLSNEDYKALDAVYNKPYISQKDALKKATVNNIVKINSRLKKQFLDKRNPIIIGIDNFITTGMSVLNKVHNFLAGENAIESNDDDLDYMDTLMEAVASKIYAIYKLAKKDFDENLSPYIKNKEYRVKDLEGSIISDTEKGGREIIGIYLISPRLVNKDMIGRFKEDMFNLLKDSSSPTGNKSYGKGVKLVDKEDPTQGCYLYAIPKGE